MSVGKGMKATYEVTADMTDDQRQALAKASLPPVEEAVASVAEPEPIEQPNEDPDSYADEARRLEITIMRGLKMARRATYNLSELSEDAGLDMASQGLPNPIQAVLGVGGSSGLPEGRVLFADLLERVADRLRRDGDFDAETLRSP